MIRRLPGPRRWFFRTGLNLPRFFGTTGSATDFSNSFVRYTIQFSDNLKAWENLEAAEVGSVFTGGDPARPGFAVLTISVTGIDSPAGFWRLGVPRR